MVQLSNDIYQSHTSPFSPPACLDLCTGGEERRKKQARTQGCLSDCGLDLPSHFLASFHRETMTSGFHLPCLSLKPCTFLFNFSAVPNRRGAVLHAPAHPRAVVTLSPLSYDPAPCPAAWGGPRVHPGRQPQAELEFGCHSQVCTGGRLLWLHIYSVFLWLCIFRVFILE